MTLYIQKNNDLNYCVVSEEIKEARRQEKISLSANKQTKPKPSTQNLYPVKILFKNENNFEIKEN